ncbi:MAG: hypothetical protein SFW67_09170 [Myxococcaceae bacterium]|nr:hypothetical protein [Myxococcaceae bacterium]
MTSTLNVTPRGALELTVESERIVARFRCEEEDRRAGARAVVEKAGRLSHPAVVPMVEEGTPLLEVRPDVPPALASLIDACVARNPAIRPEPAALERQLRALIPAPVSRRPWWKVWGS